jgi:ethanolamine utilization protein EutN
MRLGRVRGTVTGTVKDRGLSGKTLLVVDLVDADGRVVDGHHVAVDTVGAGTGDVVLVATGSAARQATAAMGIPADLAVVMIVEDVVVGGRVADPSKTDSD